MRDIPSEPKIHLLRFYMFYFLRESVSREGLEACPEIHGTKRFTGEQ